MTNIQTITTKPVILGSEATPESFLGTDSGQARMAISGNSHLTYVILNLIQDLDSEINSE